MRQFRLFHCNYIPISKHTFVYCTLSALSQNPINVETVLRSLQLFDTEDSYCIPRNLISGNFCYSNSPPFLLYKLRWRLSFLFFLMILINPMQKMSNSFMKAPPPIVPAAHILFRQPATLITASCTVFAGFKN